jgi:hypothetical protein
MMKQAVVTPKPKRKSRIILGDGPAFELPIPGLFPVLENFFCDFDRRRNFLALYKHPFE